MSSGRKLYRDLVKGLTQRLIAEVMSKTTQASSDSCVQDITKRTPQDLIEVYDGNTITTKSFVFVVRN